MAEGSGTGEYPPDSDAGQPDSTAGVPRDRRRGPRDRRQAGWQPGSNDWPGAGFNAGSTPPPGWPGTGSPYDPGYGQAQPPGYSWYGGYSRPVGPPWIVGRTADKLLALAAGFFFNVVAIVGTIVLMFVWAGNNVSPEDAATRRAHAQSVSIWSGLGCVLQFALFVLGFLVIFSVAGSAARP